MIVVDRRVFIVVEDGGEVLFGDGEAYGFGEALAQRAGGDFDAGCFAVLGMAAGCAIPTAGTAQLLHRQVVAGEMEQNSRTAARRRAHSRAQSGRDRTTAGRTDRASSAWCRADRRSGRRPSGAPGWPDFAFSTVSTARMRSVLIESWSRFSCCC